MLGHIDCQAQTIGGLGYQAMSAVGSPAMIAMTLLITVFIAVLGLRLMLGEALDVRDAVIEVLKIGVVLLLATSWPAFQTLVYDIVLRAPADLIATIAASTSLAGEDLSSRLQRVDDAIQLLAEYSSGRGEVAGTMAVRPPGIADDFAIGAGRLSFIIGILAPLAIIRIGSAILLALTPVFAALLLFSFARAGFAGWIKALLATALASVALAIVYAVELAVIEPWISNVLARRNEGQATLAAPIELLAITVSFNVAALGILAMMFRIALLPHIQQFLLPKIEAGQIPHRSFARAASPDEQRSMANTSAATQARARAIADAVSSQQRRETAGAQQTASSGSASRAVGLDRTTASIMPDRARLRASASARQRDARA